jgi:hypothetical protein
MGSGDADDTSELKSPFDGGTRIPFRLYPRVTKAVTRFTAPAPRFVTCVGCDDSRLFFQSDATDRIGTGKSRFGRVARQVVRPALNLLLGSTKSCPLKEYVYGTELSRNFLKPRAVFRARRLLDVSDLFRASHLARHHRRARPCAFHSPPSDRDRGGQ